MATNTYTSPCNTPACTNEGVIIATGTPTRNSGAAVVHMNGNNPSAENNVVQVERMKETFYFNRTKLIIIGMSSFLIIGGSIVIIIITRGENCAINNGLLSLISATSGSLFSMLLMSSASRRKG